MEEKVVKRRFSLEEDFMNYKTDDILYGFMRILSTARPNYEDGKCTWEEYLPIREYVKNKKQIAEMCNCSTRTIERHLEKLFDAGLLAEGIIESSYTSEEGELICADIPSFIFPYDESGKYQLIDKEIVKYLVLSRSPQAIRIFVYLYNKFCWKKDYTFTQRELVKALGYSQTTALALDLVKVCLNSFKNEGFIDYVKDVTPTVMDNGRSVPVVRMRLTKVIKSAKEIKNYNS